MDQSQQDTSGKTGNSRIGLGLLAAAVLVAGGAVGYRALQGDTEEAPVAAPDGDAPLSLTELEAQAQADPMNSQAWSELGFAYYSAGRYDDAARAYRQAAEGDPDNATLWSSAGEARVLASNDDPMPPEAVTAFEKALALDPTDPRARYFLAVRKDLAGDHEGAIADWLALLEDTPPGAPWEADLRRTIKQVGKINQIETASKLAKADAAKPKAPELTAGNAIPGPNQQQMDAAGRMRPSEQRDMAVSMVERLEGRLKSDPSNVDGWVMLMRSRMTLGEPDKAAKALKDAVAANPAAAKRLQQEAQALGVPAG
ncbi:MAG: tetratricopeptide repeat protein [Sphingomonadaceae bacterium]|nr:tetratricopeptide repeat protein [Sphingomonadaceae bacterium]